MTILLQQQLRELAQEQEEKEWTARPQENSMMNGQRMWDVAGPACVGCFEDWGFAESTAKYIAAASPATILALLDQVDTANANHENAIAHMQSVCAERDRLKAENVQLLAAMMHIMNEVDGNLREIARGLINHGVSTYPDSPANPNDIYEYCDTIERLIAGALPKEQS